MHESHVERHLNLAFKVAHRFAGGDQDALQSAVVGLMEGMRRYNPSLGRFSTYVFPWIVKRVVDDRNQMQLPFSMPRFMLSRKMDILSALDQADERPTRRRYEEGARVLLAKYCDGKPYRARRLASITPKLLQAFDCAIQPTAPLQAVEEAVPCPMASVEETVVASEMRRALMEAVNALDEFSRLVIVRIIVNQCPVRQLAKELGRSEYVVKKALNGALEELRQRLKNWE